MYYIYKVSVYSFCNIIIREFITLNLLLIVSYYLYKHIFLILEHFIK